MASVTIVNGKKFKCRSCGLDSNKEKEDKIKQNKIDKYGKQLLVWLYSDPEYAYRLDNEGSGNW